MRRLDFLYHAPRSQRYANMGLRFTILLSLISTLSFSQTNADSLYQVMKPKLIKNGQLLLALPVEHQRDSAAALFLEDLLTLVKVEEAMEFNYAPIRNLSVQRSDDEKVCILTYLIPRAGGRYTHVGILMYEDEEDEYHSVQLTDNSMNAEYRPLKPSSWHGGLYYDLIQKKVEGRAVYFLLGYRAVNPNVHEKFVDVLDLSNDRVQFGLPVFYIEEFNDRVFRQAPYRLRMQYSGRITAVLRWSDDYDGIVMDHVSPPDASQKGLYLNYGPDFSYDGLKWKDEMWHLESEINFQNDTQTPPAGQNVPTGLSPARPRTNGGR